MFHLVLPESLFERGPQLSVAVENFKKGDTIPSRAIRPVADIENLRGLRIVVAVKYGGQRKIRGLTEILGVSLE